MTKQVIKLPRATVRICAERGRSKAFSLHGEHEGERATIYCTGSKGGITDVYSGRIERVSRHGARPFALFEAERMPITSI